MTNQILNRYPLPQFNIHTKLYFSESTRVASKGLHSVQYPLSMYASATSKYKSPISSTLSLQVKRGHARLFITSNHRQTGVNVLGLLNRFSTSSVKCWTVNFCIHASKGPVVIMHQLKSLYNSPFKNSYSHPIHTCFPMIASND